MKAQTARSAAAHRPPRPNTPRARRSSHRHTARRGHADDDAHTRTVPYAYSSYAAMSQLVKLKAAVHPHALLAHTSAGLVGQQHRYQTTVTAAAPAPARATANNAMVARRWMSTGMAKSSSSVGSSLAAAAAAASNSQSTASAASPSSSILLGLVGLAVVGGCVIASTEVALAEGAVVADALPTIDLTTPAASSTVVAAPQKKKGKKRSSKRKQLEYPGKFGKLHAAADAIVQVPVGPGVRIQFPIGVFAPEQHPDKTCAVIPIFEIGGPNPPSMQFVVQTNLGRKHSLESYMDTMGNSTGHYKYLTEFGLSVKPSFQITGNGSMVGIDLDHKGREHAATLSIGTHGEVTASYNQSLTPQLIGGVELHYLAMMAAHLNGGVKYTTADKREVFAVTKKDGKYAGSYWRQVSETPHPLAHLGYPSESTSAGVEVNFSTQTQKSDLVLGVKHTRRTYNYQFALQSSTPSAQMTLDTSLLEDAPNFRWGINGQVNFDGSSEAIYGLSLAVNM